MSDLSFPKGFLWGAATSSHQVEGGNYNDWTLWENKGKTVDHSVSGLAADEWHHYKEDIELLKKLRLNSYRFSIEWSRVEPKEGQFDESALNHYAELIRLLREADITPVVTLYHFTSPVWIAEKGTWENRQTVDYFVRYAQTVVERFGGDVQLWCTINEPTVLSGMGYLVGMFPPGKKSALSYLRAQGNMLKAHRQMYGKIHKLHQKHGYPAPTVTFAHNIIYATPTSDSALDRWATRVYQYISNDYPLRKTKGYMDALGVNYYFYRKIKFKIGGSHIILDEGTLESTPPASDLGWHVHPESLYFVCKSLAKYKLPIYILENGLADSRDILRDWFIVRHLEAIYKAIAEGIDVRGYMYWSFIDTFEWENGFRTRYGLVEVDFENMKRTIRKSATVYAQIAEHNGIPAALLEKYR
jgi:beta-glucosidase